MDDNTPGLAPLREASVREAPVLLYDGVCALCNSSVKTILRFDKAGTMRFAALDGQYGSQVIDRHPELAAVDSIVLVQNPGQPGERTHVTSDAFLGIAEYLGGPWRTARVLRLLPRSLRDALYHLVARNRYRMFGKYDTCPIPPPEVRGRFLA